MSNNSHQWDEECDLLIVGSGAGAVTAALSAKQSGGVPLIVEKADVFGGSTALSGGVLWIPNSPVILRAGVDDDAAKGRAYLDACAGPAEGGSTRERRDAYLKHGPEMVSFLEKEGMVFRFLDGFADYHEGEYPGGLARGRCLAGEFFDVNKLGDWKPKFRRAQGLQEMPISVPEAGQIVLNGRTRESKKTFLKLAWRLAQRAVGRRIVASGGSLQGRLFLLAKNAGINIWLKSPLAQLITENNAVVGAIVNRDGKHVRVRARRGVLLDAGGFAHNNEMRASMSRVPHNKWSAANEGDTGEVMKMAMELNAATAMTQEAWWIPCSFLPGGGISWHNPIDMAKPHCVMVDQGGHRYVNEATSYVAVGLAMFERHKTVPAVPSWLILESRHRNQYRMGIAPPGKIPKDWIESGYLIKADSVEDLARQCKLPLDQLRATLERMNEMADAGKDADFGKGESAYNRVWGDPTYKNPSLGKIEKPPFYAVQVFPADVGTCGGLLADEHAQVIDNNGQVIPGLYAAGNITASVMGPSYPGAGASIGASMVFSYVAAEHAMQQTTSRNSRGEHVYTTKAVGS